MSTLSFQQHPLASSQRQLEVLSRSNAGKPFPAFREKLAASGIWPLQPTGIEVLQVNVGKQCNQTCRHCHVDAGPDRKERMSHEVMDQCLHVLKQHDIPTVDITGGAPELHPDFRWFVGQCHTLGKKILVRCNLTIILANKSYNDLPSFYKSHGVEVVSSLPFYNASRTDKQRGDGVFDKSIEALHLLNAEGYGMEDSGLQLNLVYNPSGAFLPAAQQELEAQFKKVLLQQHGVRFNSLYTITNMPISRFLDFLLQSGNYDDYMEKLVSAYNAQAARGVMCRNTLSVGWDGSLYDCDFNQMLDIRLADGLPQHISRFNLESLNGRPIQVNQHCFGCTAGAGSSCGGSITT
jgi:radical SAM/Cys-rich protein